MARAILFVLFVGGCMVGADSEPTQQNQALGQTHSPDELIPFVTDGCSMFPDGTPSDRTLWQHCCITHDFAYYMGGTADDRAAADDALDACVSAETNDVLGSLMHAGVRIGGSPALPTPWRWGYGWNYDPVHGYRVLPDDQRAAAQSQIDAYQANPVPPDALEQRLWALADYIASVPGLQDAMQSVQDEVDTL